MAVAGSNVIVDYLEGERSATKDALWIVGFSLLTALAARIEFKLPFTPVPLTGQTFAVLLSGAALGCRRGFLSQVLYLAEGAVGLPVFAGGAASFTHLCGPTAGYLWSYPFAVVLLGWLVERGVSRKTWQLAASLIACDILILVSGALWLHIFFQYPYRQAWVLGFYPFLIGDILKVALVGISLPRVLNRYNAATGPN